MNPRKIFLAARNGFLWSDRSKEEKESFLYFGFCYLHSEYSLDEMLIKKFLKRSKTGEETNILIEYLTSIN